MTSDDGTGEAKSIKDPDDLVNMLYEKNIPSIEDIKQLCARVKLDLQKQNNILEVKPPVTVVGDIHGQFYDLIELFSVAGKPPYTNFLFLGDFVDRGHFSLETLLLLFALRARYGEQIQLIRGNHETRQITQVYGFYDECMKKFGSSEIWTLCCDVFDCMPLAAIIGLGHSDSMFAVHAGLSPLCENLDQIRKLDRFSEVPHEGAICDLLWSDPEEMNGWGVSPRGAGFVFGGDIVQNFNRANGINQVVRSHQLVMVGYKEMFNSNLITIWSAPNYCYRCGNAGAVLEVDEDFTVNVAVFGPRPAEERIKPEEDNNFALLPDYFC